MHYFKTYLINNIFFKIFIIFCFFISFNIIFFKGIKNIAFDFTKDKLYTISKNTVDVIQDINEQIKIQLFFSDTLSKNFPQVRAYEKRVREILNRYEANAPQNISFEILDPKPFSDIEDLATYYGIQGLQVNEEGESFYFGAAFSNSVDDTIVIPFFDVGREQFLEYDLTKTIYNLATFEKPKIGLISSIPFTGQIVDTPQGPKLGEPFYLYTRITELFEVEELANTLTEIPEEIDQLLIIHPKKLNQNMLYAIDQFVMKGKGVTFLVDPFSEYERMRVANNEKGSNIPSSNLEKLFNKWGFSVEPGKIVGDIENGRKVSLGNNNDQKIVTYIIWLALQDKLLSREDIVSSNLDYVFFKSAGSIINLETNDKITINPLISTSKKSTLVDRFKIQFRAEPEELIKNFTSDDTTYVLGARIVGDLTSSFTKTDVNKLGFNKSKHLDRVKNANIIVYADTDFIDDITWVSKQDMFGRNNITPIADNGRLIVNSIESMTGGKNLIGLRGRGVSNRPFIVVENLQKNAEIQFREKENSLLEELEVAEKKLEEIKNKETSNAQSLDLKQNQAIEAFKEKIYDIRQELRTVQRKLGEDIKALETFLKVINIWLMPFLVVFLYFVVRVFSVRRKKVFFKKIGRNN